MNIKITKPIRSGTIKAIASKSEAHRLLICAALAGSESFISCASMSEDIEATIRCITALGAETQKTADGYYITPINKAALKEATLKSKTYSLDCGESGATLRFMLPVCGALGINAEFHMSGRLPARPLSALYDQMVEHGYMLTKHMLAEQGTSEQGTSEQGVSTLSCSGQLQSGLFTLAGNISSQYISGLLLALPLLENESQIKVTGTLESRPYVEMTLETMKKFGTQVYEDEPGVFRIPGSQNTHPSKKLQVGGDWSNAAFWLSAGAIGQNFGGNGITCTGLDLNSKQGDKAICGYLESFGAGIVYEANSPSGGSSPNCEGSVTVTPGKLQGIEVNAMDTPDLVPVLAAVASVAQGQTVIRNAQRLRMKESDRLKTVTQMLTNLGADIKETQDGLIINGKQAQSGGTATLTGGLVDAHGDHRIAMTAAILSTVCASSVIIKGANAVRKSYPGFFEDFRSLGGDWINC